MRLKVSWLAGWFIVVCRRSLDVVFTVGPCCRFSPSCTLYAKEALERHGLWRGSKLTARRILKCQFWGPFGTDPVPGGS